MRMGLPGFVCYIPVPMGGSAQPARALRSALSPEPTMKIQKDITTGILAAAALLLAGSVQLQALNYTVAAFATGTQGENSQTDGTGGQYNGDCLEIPYGNGTIWWDGITFDSALGSTGSAYLDTIFNTSDNIALLASVAPGYNNLYYEGPSGACPTGTIDFTQYSAVQFEILWDTTSTLNIDQYNTGLNWPGETSGFNADVTAGVEVDMFTGSGGEMVELGTFLIPDSAAAGWQTVTMPYPDTIPGMNAGAGLCFQKYCGNYAALQNTHNGGFWIDPVILVGNAAPPPTLIGVTIQGDGVLLSWYGMAGQTNVVQAATNLVGSNIFDDISPAIVLQGWVRQ